MKYRIGGERYSDVRVISLNELVSKGLTREKEYIQTTPPKMLIFVQ